MRLKYKSVTTFFCTDSREPRPYFPAFHHPCGLEQEFVHVVHSWKGASKTARFIYNMAMGALICTRACYVDSSFYPIGIDYSEDDPYLVQEVASFPGSHGESLLLGQRCCKLLQESRSVLLGEASLAHSTHSRLKLEKLCYQDTGDDMKLFGLRYPRDGFATVLEKGNLIKYDCKLGSDPHAIQ
ncbi:hypothetical protein BS47DRAFT_1386639 [Hydnum rufescens UP504]|uniref:Uncharacterized protein n=1 Tax=Hydnum rufescens UP504 TaxID=1448309 RepID=A0A9P6BB55_9AGAM|nr:hypothetical protein BS47DRAFT_1386639 [Hydnum rufescens UP504]